MSIEKTLEERGKRYGSFDDHALVTQALKEVMRASDNWEHLTPSMCEALDMIAHKIGRILNGDPTYVDSWHDIAGYATLVEQELNAKKFEQSRDPEGTDTCRTLMEEIEQLRRQSAKVTL